MPSPAIPCATRLSSPGGKLTVRRIHRNRPPRELRRISAEYGPMVISFWLTQRKHGRNSITARFSSPHIVQEL
jgi:hypothetical protein